VSDRNHILALTQVSFLSALILSIVSIQFVLPFSFVLLLLIVPVIFALQTYHVRILTSLVSGLAVVILSFALFGIAVGLWTFIYYLAGTMLGLGQKYRFPLLVRILSNTLAYSAALCTILLIFMWIARLGWQEITNLLALYPLLNPIVSIQVLFIGMIISALLVSLVADSFLSRVLHQLYLRPSEQ
jgi:hypothetical protein